MRENDFQSKLIKEIKVRFPGCVVMKNDANYIQGIPDLTILYGKHWAMLECKASYKDRMKPRPNQERRIEYMNNLSYAKFIYPENKEEVLNEMEKSFKGCS